MRLRTLILFAIALVLAGGTAVLVRSRLSHRPAVAAVTSPPRPAPQKSIIVARAAIARGQILKPADLSAQPWPDAAITGDYVVAGTEPAKSLVGAIARELIAAGEPIIKTKIVVPATAAFSPPCCSRACARSRSRSMRPPTSRASCSPVTGSTS